ncbi:MAG: pilus assembly protein HicB [Gammaproteobacteria bacterium]|nr:pilus assembly protein HicB [Gammaproteobacteria bacterium]
MNETARYKYPLKLPASLKETVVRLAKDDGVSLNQWIVVAVAQKVGAVEVASEFLRKRASDAEPGELDRYLDDAPDVPPIPGDELPSS